MSTVTAPFLNDLIRHRIVRFADTALRKKLLFIKPFHQSVLSVHYANGVGHTLLTVRMSESFPTFEDFAKHYIMKSLTPLHRAHVVSFRLYSHMYERDFQLRTVHESYSWKPSSIYVTFADRQVLFLEQGAFTEEILQNDRLVVYAQRLREETRSISFPMFTNGLIFGLNLANMCYKDTSLVTWVLLLLNVQNLNLTLYRLHRGTATSLPVLLGLTLSGFLCSFVTCCAVLERVDFLELQSLNRVASK